LALAIWPDSIALTACSFRRGLDGLLSLFDYLHNEGDGFRVRR
jgi:hypothetical protein